MLQVNLAESHGPGPVNEDVVGYCAGAAWVIDGATGIGAALLEEPSDAAWLARRADRELRALLGATPDLPTRDLLRAVAGACRADFERLARSAPSGDHEHPSAAFAMVREFSDRIEFCALADCRVAYRNAAGEARLFGAASLDRVEGRTIALVTDILRTEPAIVPAELCERVLPQLRENRRLMNKPGGYWVLVTEPLAADHAAIATVPRHPGRSFAIASDSFLRLVELFGVADPGDLLAADEANSFDRWLGRLRDLEREEGSCRRFPRVKVHDDASFVHCTLR